MGGSTDIFAGIYVYDVIGNRDVIHNGENGFVCTKAEDFVKVIEECRCEDEKLTERAYQDILKMYNTKVMAQMYSQKYENALKERGGVRHDLICQTVHPCIFG